MSVKQNLEINNASPKSTKFIYSPRRVRVQVSSLHSFPKLEYLLIEVSCYTQHMLYEDKNLYLYINWEKIKNLRTTSMVTSHEIITIENKLIYYVLINLIITLLFNIGWIVYCMRECSRVAIKYRICKNTPNLHPIYRDVQYLSRQRKLYNLKTHFVKYVLIVMCLSVEVCAIICTLFLIYLYNEPLTSKLNNEWKYIRSKYYQCHLGHQAVHLILVPFYIFMYTFVYFQYFLLFVLLSILTRYLAARYLNHSFKRTLLKYISWLVVQFVVVLFCSTIYTIALSSLLFPLFMLINWIVLLRDNRFLSRVLRSNLREIELHSNNKVLYREQLSAYKFYRIFQKTLLLTLFLLVILTTLFNLYIFFKLMCFFNIVSGINSTIPNTFHFSTSDNSTLHSIENIIEGTLIILYSLSTSLPIVCATLIPLVQACVKRYKSRHNVYRFNYENIKQPLLKGYK